MRPPYYWHNGDTRPASTDSRPPNTRFHAIPLKEYLPDPPRPPPNDATVASTGEQGFHDRVIIHVFIDPSVANVDGARSPKLLGDAGSV